MSDKKQTTGIVDDGAKAAEDWLNKDENKKQVGGWIAQGFAWILGLFKK